MHLFEDDLAEIILCDQQLIIKKHQPLTSMQSLCQQYLIAYAKNSGVPCIICNTENILAVRGVSLSTSARFSDDVASYIRNKQIFHFAEDAALDLIGDGKYPIDCLYPIVSGNDPAGAVILLHYRNLTQQETGYAKFLADILTQSIQEVKF